MNTSRPKSCARGRAIEDRLDSTEKLLSRPGVGMEMDEERTRQLTETIIVKQGDGRG